jgi:hypothetical protein
MIEGDIMSDEPTPRAQWNVKVFINLGLLVAAGCLIAYGLVSEQITVKDALSYVASAAFGGGIAWLSK